MKIVRFLDETNNEYLGKPTSDGKAVVLTPQDAEVGERTIQKILAPLVPTAIIGIGLNYKKHADETGGKYPDYPIVFYKGPNSLQNPFDPIELPRGLRSDQVDFEGELAVVIGQTCKNVTPENALDYVLGYTIGNDVSARDWQMHRSGRQWCRAKSFDTFCPLGPVLTTPDEIPNPNNLELVTKINGEVVQETNTEDMIFSVAEIISFLSGSSTLMAGTVILTGTPSGVGMARTPELWLKPGDQVDITISGIGTLSNPVIEEAL